MSTEAHDESLVEAERQVLRALCERPLDRRAGLSALRSYRWREPLHRLIFDFLINLRSADPELIREQLPAYLTRRGFPDFHLAAFFQPLSLTKTDVDQLIRRLRDWRIDGLGD